MFTDTDEQRDLRSAVRTLLERSSSEESVRKQMMTETGYDPLVWSSMAEMGLLGLAVPEELGGAGCGMVEVGIVMELAGAALLCAPYLSTVVLATNALLLSDDPEVATEVVPALVDGSRTAALALLEPDGRRDEQAVQLRAERAGEGWALTGRKSHVLDGSSADVLLVAARTAAGVSLFLVDATAPGVVRSTTTTMDLTRRLAAIDLQQAPARLVGQEGQAWPVLTRVLDLAAAALSADQVGGAARALATAVDYVKVRFQFGRPIGSFQAVKHKCADVLVQVESARSASRYALHVADEEPEELGVAACVALAFCSEAYAVAAAENVQLHGGTGFTWEHPAHLYFKRAASDRALLGDPAHHRALLAQRLKI